MRILLFWFGISFTLPVWLSAQVTVPMSQYDYERTGANLQEWILNPSNVNAASFGKIFSRSVDASIYALPLIIPNLNISGQRRNVLFVATMGNTVYAFDADDPARVEPYWSTKSWNVLPLATVGSGRFTMASSERLSSMCQPELSTWSRCRGKTTSPESVGACPGHLQWQPEIQLTAALVVSLRRR